MSKMAPIINARVGDAERNIHYRTLVEIIGLADRGIKPGIIRPIMIRVNYKIRLDPRDLRPVFYRDRTRAYRCL